MEIQIPIGIIIFLSLVWIGAGIGLMGCGFSYWMEKWDGWKPRVIIGAAMLCIYATLMVIGYLTGYLHISIIYGGAQQ